MHHLLARFKADDRGAIALMAGVSLVVLCMVVGGAVDFARYSNAKSQTAAALDTAVLAGARTLMLTGDPSKAEAAAAKYYEENVAGRFAVESDSVQFSVTDENKTVTGSGNAYLPKTFLKVAGIDKLALVKDPAASFPKATISGGGGSNIEVSVMLDVTGSMCDDGVGPCTTGTKIDALKTAAKDLVNIVVLDDQSQYKSRVALVPFAQRIRVAQNGQGADLMKRMTDLDATWSGWRRNCTDWNITGSSSGESGTYTTGTCNTYESEWLEDWKIRPCVTERFYDSSWAMDFTDDKPGSNAWLNGETGRRFPIIMDSASTPFTSGLGQSETDPVHQEYWTYSSNGSCSEPQSNEIMRLSSDKAALIERIDGLKGKGSTGGALDTAFAWYMLSPRWNSV
jgi:Flp pilus assembly protein TadG